MRLLVTGANGQVGWELSRSLAPLGDVVALRREDCDLSQPAQLLDVIRNLKPNVIVNAAAYTSVDKAEEEEELAMTVNGLAAGVIAEEARHAGALLVHYSTDYVFDGCKDGAYTEDDAPHPINAYGRSKLAGDLAIHEVSGDHIILRTCWVFGARGHNFLRTILRLAGEREELQIVADQIGAPTWARNIADVTAMMIMTIWHERLDGRFASGLFNLSSSGATSWYGFAEAILDHATLRSVQRRPVLRTISSSERASPATRPKNSRLAGDRVSQRFGIMLPDWKLALSLCLADMKA
jgi:dTDP-4-dehydrorhamnose reductase